MNNSKFTEGCHAGFDLSSMMQSTKIFFTVAPDKFRDTCHLSGTPESGYWSKFLFSATFGELSVKLTERVSASIEDEV